MTAGVQRRFPAHDAQASVAGGKSLPCTQLVVRVAHVPTDCDGLTDEEALHFMAQSCGLHTDAMDAAATECIVYRAMLDSKQETRFPQITLALRLRGGAVVTRSRGSQKGRSAARGKRRSTSDHSH